MSIINIYSFNFYVNISKNINDNKIKFGII